MPTSTIPPADPSFNPISVIGTISGGEPVAEPDLVHWLLDGGRRIERDVELFGALCWRILGSGVALARASLHIGTLHPQLLGFGFRWSRDLRTIEEFTVAHGVRETEDYRSSPIRSVVEDGHVVRLRADDPATRQRYPLLSSLHAAGITEYVALPLTMMVNRHQVVSWATDRAGGFAEDDRALLRRIVPALASVVEARAMRRIAGHLLDTYLGREAGPRVLAGQIHRGQGDRIQAIVMASDLRGFTRFSDLLPGEEVIALLDEYFERVAEPVRAEGGEVLKFIGDGVLSIFPVDGRGPAEAAGAALRAATAAMRALDELNGGRPRNGRQMLRAGFGLHIGEVMFGNVGAPDRLDFTVIGRAVNLAFRLESLTKRLGRPLLASRAFAAAAPERFVSLGLQPVRGLPDPEELFALP